jgi:hypothetical protein
MARHHGWAQQVRSQAGGLRLASEAMERALQGFLMELPALVACYQHERYTMLLQDFRYRRDQLASQVYIKHRNVWPFARQRAQRSGDGRSRLHHDTAHVLQEAL